MSTPEPAGSLHGAPRAAGAQRPRVVFLLSARRSGSTWIGYVLGSASNSAFVGEYYRAWNPAIRQPCALCAADGRDQCVVLGGVEHEPAARAFDAAFARTGRSVIVDASKQIDWARGFLARTDYDVRLVHVLRDPRGWYESERRRVPGSLDALVRSWVEDNQRIREFVESSGVWHAAALYDELAAAPELGFKRLFASLGIAYSDRCLQYWQTQHHAYAANGASSALLLDRPHARELEFFVTGDDAYYRQHQNRTFFDERWRHVLTADEIRSIEEDPGVGALLAAYGRTISGWSPAAEQL